MENKLIANRNVKMLYSQKNMVLSLGNLQHLYFKMYCI